VASPLQFPPLRQETRQTIRARLEADLNAGRDPNSPTYYDATPGSVISDLLDLDALEFERVWDVASVDVPAAAFVEYAWGAYLDAHAASTSIVRGEPTRATGELKFSGDNGTLIPIGAEVATIQTDAEDEPVVFRTTEAGTVESGSVTLAAEAVEAGSEGNVPANAVTDDLTGIEGIDEVTNPEGFTGGEDEETDEDFREALKLEYSANRGGGTVDDLKAWALEYPGIGYARVVPLWNGEGTARVVVTDEENNPVSQTVEDGLQAVIDPLAAQTTLAKATTLPKGTIEVASTAGFAESGRIYVGNQLVSYTGKTSTTFTGCTGGAGEIEAGEEVVQSGLGKGKGPPGLMVSVDTPSTLTVNVAADVTPDDGYSLSGESGSIDLTPDLEEAIRDYIDTLPPGGEDPPGPESPAGSGEVLRMRVAQRILEVEGVYEVDLTSIKLNAVAANLAVGALQVPNTGTITLS
jgi:uncharacterized phage protein gp47/JayE